MVSIAQTVVHKYAVVVKLLNTSIAKIAMFRIFWSQIFTIYAHVVQMITFRLNFLKNILEVWLLVYIPRIHKSQYIENHSGQKEKVANYEASL